MDGWTDERWDGEEGVGGWGGGTSQGPRGTSGSVIVPCASCKVVSLGSTALPSPIGQGMMVRPRLAPSLPPSLRPPAPSCVARMPHGPLAPVRPEQQRVQVRAGAWMIAGTVQACCGGREGRRAWDSLGAVRPGVAAAGRQRDVNLLHSTAHRWVGGVGRGHGGQWMASVQAVKTPCPSCWG